MKRLNGKTVKKGKTKYDQAQQVIDDIQNFKKSQDLDRLAMIWCGSTEIFLKPGKVHSSLDEFEKGLKKNDPGISPSMIYAYAALAARNPLRQWSTKSVSGLPSHGGTGSEEQGSYLRQRF